MINEDIYIKFEAIYFQLMALQFASKHPDMEGQPTEFAVEGIKIQLDELKDYVEKYEKELIGGGRGRNAV